MDYHEFLQNKRLLSDSYGIDVKDSEIHPMLFDFQRDIVKWALHKGRAAIFADCGMGKTPMQLAWADKIARLTNKPVLILTPLAVSYQTVREGEKFGIECKRSDSGEIPSKIIVTNYERLHFFNPSDFCGLVCDESSILKNFDGSYRNAITQFMKNMRFRLLCTATAAPNDYIELGTSSEALGYMGYMDMLTRFFRNVDGAVLGRTHSFRYKHKERLEASIGKKSFWRFKKHAETHFWRWVCSWARTLRKPSDLGYDDGEFILPPLEVSETVVPASRPLNGKLFIEPAMNLRDQREERRLTLDQRCEEVANRVNSKNAALVWCQYNAEGDLLEKIIPDGQQIKGSDSDDKKERLFMDFVDGKLRVLITKPKIGGFGLNFQHCSHMTFFPSHSWEQFYQGTRRCWRYGQKRLVLVDIITTEGELRVLANLQRKAEAADKMFSELVRFMNESLKIEIDRDHTRKERLPSWL